MVDMVVKRTELRETLARVIGLLRAKDPAQREPRERTPIETQIEPILDRLERPASRG